MPGCRNPSDIREATYGPPGVVAASVATGFLRPSEQSNAMASISVSGLKADSSRKEITEVIREFVMPVVHAILTGNADNKPWRPGAPWEKERETTP